MRLSKCIFGEAIARALREEMRDDPNIVLLGQDIGAFGGSYREFDGLYGEFGPRRVRDMPVAEAAMVGVGVGAAAAGLRSLVSITYMDFLMLGFDPLINYAAKLRYKTGGQLNAPVVVKTTAGARGQGVAHSQCLEAWLMSVPGLKVVAPSTPVDAYGLLKAALRETGPVVYIDHKRLFPIPGDVPVGEEITQIGRAAIRRAGTDLTITTHSFMTRVALEAADLLAAENVSAEIIDLRSLAPLDMDTVMASVRRTGVLLTLEEGQVHAASAPRSRRRSASGSAGREARCVPDVSALCLRLFLPTRFSKRPACPTLTVSSWPPGPCSPAPGASPKSLQTRT